MTSTSTNTRARQIVDLLKDVPLFAGLDHDDLARLSLLITEKHYPKDTVIVSATDPGDALYIVAEGEVKVSLWSDNGREIILSTLGPGSFFGEMSLVDGEPRSANVACLSDSLLLRLGRKEFLQALRGYPTIAINVMTEVCVRLRRADESIGNLALLDVYGRVARFLLERCEEEGDPVPEGHLIKKMPTQQHIASRIGTSRETVSRALSEFQRRGFIEQRGKGLLVREGLDPKAVSRGRS
ncbi:MAG TPA: Crp/Fnr family transcriptional regulator [Myxococcota bacterium]